MREGGAKELLEHLSKIANVNMTKLEIGDYLSGNVVIERKSKDFMDFKRVKSQARIMSESYRNRAFMVVDMNLDDIIDESRKRFRKDMEKQILGMVASLTVRNGVIPIFSSNPDYASYMIKALLEKANDGKVEMDKQSKPRQKKMDKKVHLLSGLPSVDDELAKRLLEEFGSVYSIMNASVKELMEVRGIGKKKAEEIYNVIRDQEKTEEDWLEDDWL